MPNGLLAAKRVGLFCIAIPNPLTGQLPLDHADLRLTSRAGIPLETLLVTVQNRLLEQGAGVELSSDSARNAK